MYPIFRWLLAATAAVIILIAAATWLDYFGQRHGWWNVRVLAAPPTSPPTVPYDNTPRTEDGFRIQPPGLHPHNAYRCTKIISGQPDSGWCWRDQ